MSEPKVTQIYKLFKLLESGEPVRIDEIAKQLGIKYWSVECYVHQMRHLKPVAAELEHLKEGRKAYAIKLLNAKDIDTRTFMYRSNNSVYVKPESISKVKVEPTKLEPKKVHSDRSGIWVEGDDDLAEPVVEKYNEKEVLDTMESLGIDNDHFTGNWSSEI
jgi:hypothetical protein